MTYPRRAQTIHRVQSWAAYAAGGAAVAGMPFAAASSPATGAGLLAAALGLLVAGRRSDRRAARYRVGAQSERLVARELRLLEERGWRVRNSVEWPGRGDIDHVVRAPGGPAFAIETKTGSYTPEHLARTRAAAEHVRRSCFPVICLARRRGVSRVDQGVLVVSADRLVARLTQLAGAR
jgi:hypothetical protein